jgi:membrane protein
MIVLYRFLPAVKISWTALAKASVVVAILFTLGKEILGLIIGRSATITAYGAAGSLIALLLWIFYSGQIFYLGAAGLRLYLDDRPDGARSRYEGNDSVLRVTKRKEPAHADYADRLVDKFLEGFRRGWRS